MQTKTIGILGLGKLSTLFYIKELNAAYTNKNSERNTFPYKLLNTNFDKINNLLPTPSKELDRIVKNYLDEIIGLDINTLLVPNITLHETIDRLKFKTKIIHPIHDTISEIKKQAYKKMVLFGSIHTMKSNYIKSNFAENEIEVLLPSKKDMLFIDDVRKQVYQKKETNDLLDNFNLMIKKYAKKNAVVIACTELSLASTNRNLEVFDMARVQINQAVKEVERHSN